MLQIQNDTYEEVLVTPRTDSSDFLLFPQRKSVYLDFWVLSNQTSISWKSQRGSQGLRVIQLLTFSWRILYLSMPWSLQLHDFYSVLTSWLLFLIVIFDLELSLNWLQLVALSYPQVHNDLRGCPTWYTFPMFSHDSA